MSRSIMRSAVFASLVIAFAATVLVIQTWHDFGPPAWQGWHFVEPVAIAGAWLAVVAWATEHRWFAIPGHLASLLAPWGFLFPLPLLALILAIVAATTSIRSTRTTTTSI